MNNIVLIGFMGSGKTSFGHWLMENVGLDFADTDEYIEQQQRRKIKDIFATDGEAYFRELETKTLEYFTQGRCDMVLSVGGGVPVREVNRELMRQVGVVVYLRASVDTLVSRLRGDDTRPLLADSNPEERIRKLMAERKEMYLDAADIIIDTDGKSFETIYGELENKLIEWRDTHQ